MIYSYGYMSCSRCTIPLHIEKSYANPVTKNLNLILILTVTLTLLILLTVVNPTNPDCNNKKDKN